MKGENTRIRKLFIMSFIYLEKRKKCTKTHSILNSTTKYYKSNIPLSKKNF